ncbi:MID1 [Branchiostoma lanceolatum]|uniref:MID1 protein n=1 Tax=Branchiostoma lanceolatum TaxID=7740 RepID=A0A8J9YPI7_BRALA|nr:MID1 [Branchiostoma lanceolatum]
MEGLEDELTCPVCLELYTCPLLLPCHHNLCLRCAEAFLETPSDEPEGAQAACSSGQAPPSPEKKLGSFACPTCREEVHLGDRGVDGLRRNLLLQNIIDRFKHAQSQWKRDAVPCLVCDATPPRDAVKTCTNCKLSYCRDCLPLVHPSRGAMANHQLVAPMESFDALQKTVMCPDHKNKPVELYCKKDGAPVCSLCKLVGKHKEHDVAALEEVFGGKKEDLQKVVKEMEGKIEKETTKIKELETRKVAMENHGAQVKSQIQTQCNELISIIREREVAMVAKVDEVVRDDTAKIQTFIDRSQEKVKNANSCLAYANEAVKETDPACFLQTEQLVKGRVDKSNSMFVNNEQHTHIPTDRVSVDLSSLKSLLKGLHLPHAPVISQEQCTATAHEATVSWDNDDDQDSKFDVVYSCIGETTFKIPNIQRNSCKVKCLKESKSYSVTVISKTKSGTAKSDSFPMETTSEPVAETMIMEEEIKASPAKSLFSPSYVPFPSTKTVPTCNVRSSGATKSESRAPRKKRGSQPIGPSTLPTKQPESRYQYPSYPGQQYYPSPSQDRYHKTKRLRGSSVPDVASHHGVQVPIAIGVPDGRLRHLSFQ